MTDTEPRDRAETPLAGQQDASHSDALLALVVGAIAGASTGVGIGMVIGAWLL